MIKNMQTAAVTYFTGDAIRIIDTIKGKTDKRARLQSGLEQLQLFRASESMLDPILKTNVEKNMRV